MGKTFVTDGNQRNRERSSLLTEIIGAVFGVKLYLGSQWQSQNGRRHSTAGMATWVNMGAGQTREAKEIAMRVMVIRILMDEKLNHEEGHMHVITNSYLEQASNMQQ